MGFFVFFVPTLFCFAAIHVGRCAAGLVQVFGDEIPLCHDLLLFEIFTEYYHRNDILSMVFIIPIQGFGYVQLWMQSGVEEVNSCCRSRAIFSLKRFAYPWCFRMQGFGDEF